MTSFFAWLPGRSVGRVASLLFDVLDALVDRLLRDSRLLGDRCCFPSDAVEPLDHAVFDGVREILSLLDLAVLLLALRLGTVGELS